MKTITERQVKDKLREWFDRGKIDQVLPVEPGVWQARLMDGGLAYAIVQEDEFTAIGEGDHICGADPTTISSKIMEFYPRKELRYENQHPAA